MQLFGRLADAIVTRCLPFIREAVREEIEHRRDADRREVRELVAEMDDVLEKFTRVVARQAKRRSRDMKAALDDDSAPTAAPEVAGGHPMTLQQRKSAIRARIAAARTHFEAEA